MSITVRYFASLRDQLGRDGESLAPEGIQTVMDVWNKAHGDEKPPPRVLLAVNLNYARWEDSVADGDEVGFFPPVTGG